MERGNPVQVLGKVALIFDVLAEEQEVTAGRLADLTGEPRSTVYRLLASLQGLDMVEPGSRRGNVPARAEAAQAGERRRRALRRAPGGAARDGTPSRGDRGNGLPLYPPRLRSGLHRANRRALGPVDGAATRRLAAAARRSGPAGAPRQRAALVLGGVREPRQARALHAGRRPTTKASLFRALEDVLAAGCSISDEDVVVGMAAVGAAVFDHRGEVCAALSMSGPKPAILGDNAAASRALLLDAAADVSRALGFAGEPAAARADR